jgi:hypothetical protein
MVDMIQMSHTSVSLLDGLAKLAYDFFQLDICYIHKRNYALRKMTIGYMLYPQEKLCFTQNEP